MCLKVLLLGENRLKRIDPRWFQSLFLLENLYLNNNRITEITENVTAAFQNTRSLIILNLAFNKIAEIDENLFAPLVALAVLNLSGNHIDELKMDTFMYLKNLKILRLDNNRLASIHPRLFKRLYSCTFISLFNNFKYGIIREKNSSNFYSLFLPNDYTISKFPFVKNEYIVEINSGGFPFLANRKTFRRHINSHFNRKMIHLVIDWEAEN